MSIQDDLAAETIERKNNPVAIIVLVGIMLIAGTYIVSKNIREEAERHLAMEESITAELNKLALSEKKFKDERKAAAEEREFNRFLYGSSEPPPSVTLQKIERDLKELKARTPQD